MIGLNQHHETQQLTKASGSPKEVQRESSRCSQNQLPADPSLAHLLLEDPLGHASLQQNVR